MFLEVKLSPISVCDCCGREKLTKTFLINTEFDTVFLGYKCCARWFKLNMSGNKYQALSRLEHKIKYSYTDEQLTDILMAIKASEADWQQEKASIWDI